MDCTSISAFLARPPPRLSFSAASTDKPYHIEYRFREARTGHYRWHLGRALPVTKDRGAIVKWFGTATDIQEQKSAEEALRKTEKLAVAGRLAASIAHEINNPLEAITNLLFLIQSCSSVEEAHNYSDTAQKELARVSEIVTQTLRFYRQPTNPAPVDISELLDSLLLLYHARLLTRGVTVLKRYRATEPIVGFSGELRQLFANLISNALDALKPGGRLAVRTRNVRRLAGSADLSTGVRGTAAGSAEIEGVQVIIADDGSGMPPEVKEHIFEPFFSTKGATGTGLRLWISAEILQKHAARATVKSRVNSRRAGGTIFRIFLPANHVPAENTSASTLATPPPEQLGSRTNCAGPVLRFTLPHQRFQDWLPLRASTSRPVPGVRE